MPAHITDSGFRKRLPLKDTPVAFRRLVYGIAALSRPLELSGAARGHRIHRQHVPWTSVAVTSRAREGALGVVRL